MNNGRRLAFAGVYRPTDVPPGFGFPCFTDGKSLWVQEYQEGKVEGFVRCDVEEEGIMQPEDAHAIKVPKVGEPSLYTFHFPDNTLRVGSHDDIAKLLTAIVKELAATPFVLEEVAEFLGDDALMKQASELATKEFPQLTERGGYLSSPAKNGPLGTTPGPVQAKFKVGQSTGGLVVGRNLKLRQGLSVLTTSFSNSLMGTGSGLRINITSKPQPKPRRLVRLKGASGSMAAKPIPRTKTLARKRVAAKSASRS